MRPDLFLATIGRGSNGSNALEVTEDRAAVTAESQDNIINRVNNVSQYGPSWHYVPGIGVAGTAYAEVPGSALGDLAFSRASSKTRTNAAGVVETIGNNVPPHDYRNADGTLSTFPRLNLEPQRTNLNIFSEDITNATWDKFNVITTNYSNVVVSPDGFTNADKIIPDTTSNSYHGIQLSSGRPTLTSGVVYTFSVFAKAQGYDKIRVQNFSQQVRAQFNLTTGTLINQSGTTSTFIIPYGNGWYRIGFTYTQTSTIGAYWNTLVVSNDDNTGNAPIAWAGNGTDSIAVWGHTIEAGAYATSYIPTTTAVVTRLADTAEKTGVSSLIGQSQGTFFIECNVRAFAEVVSLFALSDGTSLNRIRARRTAAQTITLERNLSGQSDQTVNFTSVPTSGSIKAAFAWSTAANGFALYINGTGNSSASALPMFTNQLSRISVGTLQTGGSALGDGVTQAALFTTRLPNATLAQLTTL